MNVTDCLLAGRGWSRFNLTRAGLNEMTEVKQKSSEIIVLIDFFLAFEYYISCHLKSPENDEFTENRQCFFSLNVQSVLPSVSSLRCLLIHFMGRAEAL